MTTTTWTGTNGNWTDPTWSSGVPNASLDAVIDGTAATPDTVTFNTPSGAAHSLSMASATLAMAGGTLTLGNSSSLDAINQSGGVLDFAAGGTVGGSLSQSAGTIEIDSGTLVLEPGATDSGSLAGAVTGSGEIELMGGPGPSSITLTSGVVLSVATLAIGASTGGGGVTQISGDILYAGDLILQGTAAFSEGTLLLNGHTFTSTGTAELDGSVEGPGTILVSGSADANGLSGIGNVTLSDAGLITQDGGVGAFIGPPIGTFAVDVLAGATWAIVADVALGEEASESVVAIANSGLLEKTGGTGESSSDADVINTGTISVSAGNLQFVGAIPGFPPTSFTNTGLIDAAAGEIGIDSNTITNLSAGILTAGTWEAGAGTLAITGGAITTDAATIILSGAGSSIQAGGTLLEQSLTTIAAHGALEILGSRGYTTANSITDSGQIQLSGGTFSDTGTLTIAAGGRFSGTGTLSAVAIKNSGSLVAAAGATLVVTGPVTGKGALVATGTLDLTGVGNVINAKILGPGLLEFGGGSTTIDSGVGGSIGKIDLLAGATLTMGLGAAYNGAFTDTAAGGTSTLNLAGHKVSLGRGSFTGSSGGTALIDGGGTLTNTGTMTLNGAAIDGGTALSNSKVVKQTGSLALGDTSGGTASISNSATGTYDITAAVSLSAASATADHITNAGLFEMTGSGTAVIGAAFTNTGTIDVTSGTLEITAAFTNSGTIIGTEMQSNGTTFITAPVALFIQYATAMDSASSGAALVPPPQLSVAPSLAAPHGG